MHHGGCIAGSDGGEFSLRGRGLSCAGCMGQISLDLGLSRMQDWSAADGRRRFWAEHGTDWRGAWWRMDGGWRF